MHVDGVSGKCSIIVEFEWENGDLAAHLRTETCGGHTETVAAGLGLGDTFSFSLVVDEKTVSVSTSKGDITPWDYTWMNTSVPIYFKAGNYVQEAGTDAAQGAVVKILALSVTHA